LRSICHRMLVWTQPSRPRIGERPHAALRCRAPRRGRVLPPRPSAASRSSNAESCGAGYTGGGPVSRSIRHRVLNLVWTPPSRPRIGARPHAALRRRAPRRSHVLRPRPSVASRSSRATCSLHSRAPRRGRIASRAPSASERRTRRAVASMAERAPLIIDECGDICRAAGCGYALRRAKRDTRAASAFGVHVAPRPSGGGRAVE
jgi:hypothetical protein